MKYCRPVSPAPLWAIFCWAVWWASWSMRPRVRTTSIPERITVIMTPTNFPNEPARDAHFAKAKVRIEQAADEELKRLRNNCGANNREICRMEEKPVADARDRAVEEIERKRLAAKVAAAS